MATHKNSIELVATKPKRGTPTSIIKSERKDVGGVVVCMKGMSPTGSDNAKSPYRERAAYLVAKILGFRTLVPPTALHILDGEVVSIQKWVKGTKPSIYARKPDRLLLFDYIIGNSDRHAGNWFKKGRSGKVWAIDNAYSFNVVELVIKYSPGDNPLPHQLMLRLERLVANPHLVHRRLGKLLQEEEIEALVQRMAEVNSVGFYPAKT